MAGQGKKGFTQRKTKETDRSLLNLLQGSFGPGQHRRDSATGSGLGAVVKGEGKIVWEVRIVLLWDPCPGVIAHWSVRAYRYFEASRLIRLFVFGRGGNMGPFHIPSLKPVA